jgi:hypothetical protein
MLMSRAPLGRLLVALFSAGAVLAACAADSGDLPKGSAPGDDSDSGVAAYDSSLPSVDSSSGGVDSTTSDDTGSPVETEASAEDSPAVVTCTNCPLIVEYMTSVPAGTQSVNDISADFEILNNGVVDEDLTVITLRYWYTEDTSTSQAFNCDYAALPGGSASISGTFVAMTTPTPTADHYLELSFSSGTVAGEGGSTGGIQTRFHDTGFMPTDPSNDYSFDGADTTYTQSTRITLYRSGTLVWGVEPTGNAATGAEPTGAEPAGAEPTGAEPAGAEPTGAEPTGAEPTGAEPTGGESPTD